MSWAKGAVALASLITALLAPPVFAAGPNPAQRAFVDAHGPFTYCVDPDWAPFETIDGDGQHQGIAADLLRLAAERAGIRLTLVPTTSWNQSLALSRAGGCDLLSFLNQSPQREQWLVFTRPLFTDRQVVVTREDHAMVEDLAALGTATIALPRGTFVEEMIRRDFPRLRVLVTETEDEAFFLVSNRQAELTIRSLTVAVHTIKTQGWFNLKVAGQLPGYENHLRIGIARDLAPLRDILDQSIATITAAERNAIANRHVAITVQYGIDYALIARIIGAFSIALLTSLAWLIKVRAMNRRLLRASLTDPLTGLANRAALNQHLARELAALPRRGGQLTLILADLDHFKRVNDQLGHLRGDHVLKEFAALARAALPPGTLLGRWGGEEFLIVCTDKDGHQADALAETLAKRVRAHDFAIGRRQTVSLGVAGLTARTNVAGLTAQELIDSVLARADRALYQAKAAGRDCVCTAPPP